MDGGHVLEAAGECRALLGAAVDQDWTRPILEMEWTVAQAVTHMSEGTRANGRIALPDHPRQPT